MAALLTINDFCDEYSVSRSTCYRLRDSGDVPHVHIGRATRIRREDAERWYQSLVDAANDDPEADDPKAEQKERQQG